MHYGVGRTRAAMQADIHAAYAALQPANAGVAAIMAPGTVPKVKPAAVKQATTSAEHPA